MIISNTCKKIMTLILIVSMVLSALFIPKITYVSADAEEPVVTVLGATLRFESKDNNGRQSMRIGIQVNNANKARACAIEMTADSRSYTITTEEIDPSLGAQQTTLHSKDRVNNSVVYAIVITNVPENAFSKDIHVVGKAKGIDGTIYTSDASDKSVASVFTAMKKEYPRLSLCMVDGSMYKNAGASVLEAADIADYEADPTPGPEATPVPTRIPASEIEGYRLDLSDTTLITGNSNHAYDAISDCLCISTNENGNGKHTYFALPEEEVSRAYSNIVVEYEIISGSFGRGYHKHGEEEDTSKEHGVAQFDVGKVKETLALNSNYDPVGGFFIVDWYSTNANIKVYSVIFTDPKNAAPTSTPTATPVPTVSPVPTATPNTYVVDFSDSSKVYGEKASLNGAGNLVITGNGTGKDTFILIPADEAAKRYQTITVTYSSNAVFGFKYHKQGASADTYKFEGNSSHQFSSSSTSRTITIDSGYIPVDKLVLFDWYSTGTMTVYSIIFSDPLGAPTPTPVPTATPLPTATPTPEPTTNPELYDTELFRVTFNHLKTETVNGNTCTVDMKFFNGNASGTYFNGSVLSNNSCDVVKTYTSTGEETHKARYFLTGNDINGSSCKIFVEDASLEVKNDGTIITKPIFITNSSNLSFLETADIQGRVTEDGSGNKVVRYMWNSSNTTPVPFREVHIPDSTHNYTKEVFTVNIDVGSSDSVTGTNGSATMIYFGGRSNCSNFNGNIVASDADTRLQYNGTIQTLSARYILSGTRSDGVTPMKIYVENNGIDNNGMVTEPTIITDNPNFAYVESAPTHGTVGWEPGLTIHLWTTP